MNQKLWRTMGETIAEIAIAILSKNDPTVYDLKTYMNLYHKILTQLVEDSVDDCDCTKFKKLYAKMLRFSDIYGINFFDERKWVKENFDICNFGIRYKQQPYIEPNPHQEKEHSSTKGRKFKNEVEYKDRYVEKELTNDIIKSEQVTIVFEGAKLLDKEDVDDEFPF